LPAEIASHASASAADGPLFTAMIDAEYFRKRLTRDVAASGDAAVVEVRLQTGQFHRVRNVLSVEDAYVILETYEHRGNEIVGKENWQDQIFGGKTADQVSRAIVPYESILDVVLVVGRVGTHPRIGFGTRG
jgi:hypothetical protein